MGLSWSRCRCCDSDDNDEVNGINHNESLLRRGASIGLSRAGSHSPEEQKVDYIKSRFFQIVQMPKLVPATADEEREYMVRSYSSGTIHEIQPECLLCLDTFSESRPNALSLCACGVNKNTFHVECLLEWRRKSNKTNCPVCEHELYLDDGHAAAPEQVTLTETLVEDDDEHPRE